MRKNAVEAARWYRKAADQGMADAQRSIGACYAFGDGVEKNAPEAVRRFRMAAAQGNEEAKARLRKFEGK